MNSYLDKGRDPLNWAAVFPAERSHIALKDVEMCRSCPERPCTFICPSQVYTWLESSGRMDVRYQRCIECGACAIACPRNIVLEWPPGGAGVFYGRWDRPDGV